MPSLKQTKEIYIVLSRLLLFVQLELHCRLHPFFPSLLVKFVGARESILNFFFSATGNERILACGSSLL